MRRYLSPWILLLLGLVLIPVVVMLSPIERTLGIHVRLVYLHGAWVWTALLGFLAAALSGVIGLLARVTTLQRWSLALGVTATLFWITYLPLSLIAMQLSWNGLFLAEPRWRIGVDFAVVASMLQIAILLMRNLALGSALNLGFTIILLTTLARAQEVMHPSSPIASSDSVRIQAFFFSLCVLCVFSAWQFSRALYLRSTERQ